VDARREDPLARKLVFVGLGSNLGDRVANLGKALTILQGLGFGSLTRSSIYASDAVEVIDQKEFLNQVIGFHADSPPESLLELCLTVETSLGRVRDRDKGPRLIDLDLLLSGDDIRAGEAIQVPHPRLHLRRFVLLPLVEIAPYARHPVLGRSAQQLLQACPDRSRVERIAVE
jgi:2-amino-4-hydroxy-6-hydroxymethyldihydropteridine diphosphokinase